MLAALIVGIIMSALLAFVLIHLGQMQPRELHGL